MGLDGVELIMAVEEDFGLDITDEEFGECYTVENLLNIVWNKIKDRVKLIEKSTNCETYLLQTIAEVRNTPINSISLNSKLDKLFPKTSRAEDWEHLLTKLLIKRNNNYLTRPLWMNLTIWTTAFAILIAGWMFIGVLVAFLAFFTFLIILFIATRKWKIEFNKNYKKVEDILAAVKRAQKAWSSKDDTYAILKDIIVKQLGVDPEMVVPEARFIEDLGVD